MPKNKGTKAGKQYLNALLGNTGTALSDRYDEPRNLTPQDTFKLAQQVEGDMSLGDYKIRVDPNAKLPPEILGQHTPSTGQIKFDPQQIQSGEGSEAAAHEFAHFADTNLAGYRSGNPTHHKYYREFEANMSRQVMLQNRIENGLAIKDTDYMEYPWLRNITPLSSNKLANPWEHYQDKPAVPADIQNMFFNRAMQMRLGRGPASINFYFDENGEPASEIIDDGEHDSNIDDVHFDEDGNVIAIEKRPVLVPEGAGIGSDGFNPREVEIDESDPIGTVYSASETDEPPPKKGERFDGHWEKNPSGELQFKKDKVWQE